jgi:hypothetical protein
MRRRQHLRLVAGLLASTAAAPLILSGCSSREAAPEVKVSLLDGRQQVVGPAGQGGARELLGHQLHDLRARDAPDRQHPPEIPGARVRNLAVAMSYDQPDYVAGFAKTRGLPFMVALDKTGEAAKAFGQVRLTPTSFLLDKHGNIVKKYVGEPDFAALHQLIGQLLAET